MTLRSPRTVAVAVALGYVLAWGLGVVIGLAAMALVTDGEDGGWAALGALALGLLAGVAIGHIVWAVLVVRLLRPYGRPIRTVATVVLTPATILGLMVAINDVGIPWPTWPVVAVTVPGALAWWTASAA